MVRLEVMTRDDVPPFTDRAAWQGFPFSTYQLVIVDSLDASTEGVGEQDSAVLREVLGNYSTNTPFTTLERQRGSSIPNDLAALVGRRLVTAGEVTDDQPLNEARLKALAGEDDVTARLLYREFFTFRPVAKLWLAVNHRPLVLDDSAGFWRKMRLIPFTQSFKDRSDQRLEDTLRGEYPGILAWAVRGCLEWRTRGLEPPQAIRTATAAYQEDSDHLAAFLAAAVIEDPAGRVAAGDLYKVYCEWAALDGLPERERLSNQGFGMRMGERVTRTRGSKGRFYLGITITGRWTSLCSGNSTVAP